MPRRASLIFPLSSSFLLIIGSQEHPLPRLAHLPLLASVSRGLISKLSSSSSRAPGKRRESICLGTRVAVVACRFFFFFFFFFPTSSSPVVDSFLLHLPFFVYSPLSQPLLTPLQKDKKMGKRKSSKKPVAKKVKPKLETSFNCPFCNAAAAVTATLDLDRGVGKVACGVCREEFVSNIDSLAEPVDVYASWIDACEEANKQQPDGEGEEGGGGAAAVR